MLTRAAARREAEQIKNDEEVTANSGVESVSLDEVPSLFDDQDSTQKQLEEEAPKEDEPESTDTAVDDKPEEDLENTWQPTYLDVIADEPVTVDQKPTKELCMHVTRADLVARQQEDPTLQPMRLEAREKDNSPYLLEDGLLMKEVTTEFGETRKLIAIPKNLRPSIFHSAHTLALAGHLEKKRTTSRITQHFYWPGLGKDVQKMCQQCPDCQKGNRR